MMGEKEIEEVKANGNDGREGNIEEVKANGNDGREGNRRSEGK